MASSILFTFFPRKRSHSGFDQFLTFCSLCALAAVRRLFPFAFCSKVGEWFYAETVMNTEKEDNCELCLVPQDKRNDGESEKWTAADIFAPHDAPVNTDMPTLEQKAKGNKRL